MATSMPLICNVFSLSLSTFETPPAALCPTPRRRDAKRLEARVRATGAGLEAFQVGAGVGARQIQDLAPEVPIFLDLRVRFCRASGEFAILPTGRGDGA